MSTNLHIEIRKEKTFIYTGARAFDANLESVVFIHGAAMDHSVWVLPSRYFARHNINVLSIDLVGHGRSTGEPETSIEGMADWVIEVLDTIGIAKTAIVGHSMGSLVAFDAARRYTDRIRSLTLVGSALPMAVSDPLLNSSKANSHDAIDMLTYWGYSKAAQMGGNQSPGMWMVGGTMRLLENAAPGVLHNDLNACNEYRIDADQEPSVNVPTLLILGNRDIMTPPRNSTVLKQLLPNSRTTILDGSGHSLMAERPNLLLDALITNI